MPMMAEKIRRTGAKVNVGGANWNEADAACKDALAADPFARYIPPFDDPLLWQGHSSIVEELKEQLQGVEPDLILLSVGGGGLLCGVQQGILNVGWTNTKILAIETEGAASFAAAKLAGKVVSLEKIATIASTLGALAVTPATLSSCVPTSSLVVTDRQAVQGLLLVAEELRQMVEPACGAAVAVLADEQLMRANLNSACTVVVIVCGGSAVSVELMAKWKSDFDL